MASHTGDAIRAIYSSVSVNVVHAPRCRAQCDVLVIPQLVTIVPHIFLSHFCASSSSSSSCYCSCNTAYCRIFVDPKNRQIDCVSPFF